MKGHILLVLNIATTVLHSVTVWGNMPPTFVKDMNLETIKEDMPIGTSIYQLEGKDPEGGPVLYGLIGNDQLVVDTITGVVSVAKTLDYETSQTLKFKVVLEDVVGEGQENNRVINPVSVVILDANDNSPTFQNDMFDIFVKEDTLEETPILKEINITDVDLVGENLTVSCMPVAMFQDACDVIEIMTYESSNMHFSGSLVLKKKLDYDIQHFYQLLLIGSDGNHNVSVPVTVRLLDVQNKPPIFISPLFADVNESTPTGIAVMQLKAKDGDTSKARELIFDLVSNPEELFSIHPQNGEIRIANTVDREALPSSVVTLKVRVRELDNGVPLANEWSSSTADVHIMVHDINDEPPRFSIQEIEVNCSENTIDESNLQDLNLFVFDPDISAKSDISINLIDPSGFFRIYPNQVNGSALLQIKTKQGPLDYENPNHRKFILLVIAKEISNNEHLSSTATVTVNILDVNDNMPYFDKEEYVVSVMESVPSGSTVTQIAAFDKDSGDYGTSSIRYSLFGEGAEKFIVNETTGLISIADSPFGFSGPWIDFESEFSYYLTYQARDEYNNGLMSVVPLKIKILDADDNPPVFKKAIYLATINEGDIEFSPHLTIEAKDKDKSSVLRYEVIDGNSDQIFAINSVTGELRASNESGLFLGAIKTNKFNLTVKVTDSGTNSDTAVVLIKVQDINNNIPLFDRKIYNSNISEMTLPNTFIVQVSASDVDSRDGSNVTYRISRGARDNFVVNGTTGIISVSSSAKFDYEKQPYYNIEVVAVDKGIPPRTATATVAVGIQNTNDKPPKFVPKIQRAQVFEDAKINDIIHILNAADPDAQSPESLKYYITDKPKIINKMGEAISLDDNKNSDFFSVDENNGTVMVIRELLREKQAEIRLNIKVVDTSTDVHQTGTGTLIVSIIDINDSPPIFPEPWKPDDPTISITVLEEQPLGSIAYTFVAIDEDSNIAGYAIIPDDPYFEIDTISGVVTTKSRIDYEIAQKIDFMVAAFDSGVPQLSATALVTASVINLNDNDPSFSQLEYSAAIAENSEPNTYVVTVLADDKDLGQFGQIHYELISDNQKSFTIDGNGVIQVGIAAILDRENTTFITIHVRATDDAPDEVVKRSTSVPVHIELLDVNDNAPQFMQKEYYASIMDNLLIFPPTPILQLLANDADEGLNAVIYYKIIAGNEEGAFVLNPVTGVLFPAFSLIGRSKTYNLVVEARDKNGTGSNYDQTTLHIDVQQVNGNAPRIITPTQKNSTIFISENEVPSPKNVLCTVHAEDSDEGANGLVHYFIRDDHSNVDKNELFSINSSNGQLLLHKVLDREQKSKYVLLIVARDNGMPQPFETLQQLIVVVNDINDNEPYFQKSVFTDPYTFQIEENLQIGALVGHLKARDADINENAIIYYYLVGSSEDWVFAVDRLTGNIYTNKSLDFEQQQQYNLIVRATNNASFNPHNPEQRIIDTSANKNDPSLAFIRVYVLDINDNAPAFEKSSYLAGVSTNAKIGEIVAAISAYDPDEDDNGKLTYSIEKITLFSLGTRTSARVLDMSPFAITNAGTVVTTAAMNIYSQDHFKLIIKSRENKLPHRSASTVLEAFVYDTEQLVKIVITISPKKVVPLMKFINNMLSNASSGIALITDTRSHIPLLETNNGEDWTEIVFLVIDAEKRVVKQVPDILEAVASKAMQLHNQPEMFKIAEIAPFLTTVRSAHLDPVLIAFIALCFVLLIGIFLVVIVIQCLKNWYKDRKIAIVKKREVAEPPITTENPLWIDQDNPVWTDPSSKIYEEQELSMHVITTEQELHNKKKESQPEAMYATVRRNAKSVRENISAMDANDGYATLNQPHDTDRSGNYSNGAMRHPMAEYHEMHLSSTDTIERFHSASPMHDDSDDYLPPPPTVSYIPIVTPLPDDGNMAAGQPLFRTEIL